MKPRLKSPAATLIAAIAVMLGALAAAAPVRAQTPVTAADFASKGPFNGGIYLGSYRGSAVDLPFLQRWRACRLPGFR
ncbi:MAG: hypothetical protein LBD31_08770 [Treponema sp.]|nr:hypothetical protein [Treponema sp.]